MARRRGPLAKAKNTLKNCIFVRLNIMACNVQPYQINATPNLRLITQGYLYVVAEVQHKEVLLRSMESEETEYQQGHSEQEIGVS